MKAVAVMLGLLGGAFLYLGWRLVAASRRSGWTKAGGWLTLLLLVSLIASLPLSWWFRWEPPEEYHTAWMWGTFVSMGLFLFLGLAVFLRDCLWFLSWFAGRRNRALGQPWRSAHERRALWLQWLVFLPFPLLVGHSALEARRTPRVTRLTLPLQDLAPDLVNFRWVHLSDLHIGNTISRPFVERIVQRVNSLQPDAVAITGDIVDGDVSRLSQDVAPLAGLQAPHGVFFVTGNHEYYTGDVTGWVEYLSELGLTPLINEHRVVQRGEAALVVAGVTDHRAGAHLEGHRSDVEAALAGAPEGMPRIMLAHRPVTARAATSRQVDVQLSGHTHGGQIFPFHVVARMTQPFLAGQHRVGAMWLYVSRGTGYWGPPFRWLASSEIALLRLVAQP